MLSYGLMFEKLNKADPKSEFLIVLKILWVKHTIKKFNLKAHFCKITGK